MKKRTLCAVFMILAAVVLCSGCGKKKAGVSGNQVSGAAVSAPAAPSSAEGVWNQGVSGNTSYTSAAPGGVSSNGLSSVEFTTGTTVVDFANASDNMAKAAAAKQAMAGQAYFSGKAVTVNDIMTAYGAGEWSAIVSPQNEVCVWYSGMHGDEDFKVNFVLYEDGTFTLDSITVLGEKVDDYVDYMQMIAGK